MAQTLPTSHSAVGSRRPTSLSLSSWISLTLAGLNTLKQDRWLEWVGSERGALLTRVTSDSHTFKAHNASWLKINNNKYWYSPLMWIETMFGIYICVLNLYWSVSLGRFRMLQRIIPPLYPPHMCLDPTFWLTLLGSMWGTCNWPTNMNWKGCEHMYVGAWGWDGGSCQEGRRGVIYKQMRRGGVGPEGTIHENTTVLPNS